MRHLATIPYSHQNMHSAAKMLGIPRHWFHRDHYDIPVRLIEAVKADPRTTEIRPREMLKIVRKTAEK